MYAMFSTVLGLTITINEVLPHLRGSYSIMNYQVILSFL